MKTDRPINCLSASSAFAFRAWSVVSNSTMLQVSPPPITSHSPAAFRGACWGHEDL